MRVLILSEWYPSADSPVAGTFVRDQAHAVSERHDVTVMLHAGRVAGPRLAVAPTEWDGRLRTIRIATRLAPDTLAGRALFVLAASRELGRLNRDGWSPDVVHAHVITAGLVGLVLSRGRRPVVVTEHHSDFIEGTLGRVDRRLAHFVFKRARLVTAVSEVLRRHLEAFEPRGRYAHVPNVVDLEPFRTAARSPRPAGSPLRLLAVAMLERQKGIEYLIEALAAVRRRRSDFTLDIVGDGPLRPALERLAADRDLGEYVHFHGAASRTEVAAWTARSDVMVVPSVVETFGIVAVEAVAAGLPVITTTALPDHERIAEFGLIVPPADPEALAEAVLSALDRPAALRRGDVAGFIEPFGPAHVARRWDEIYEAAREER